MSLQLVLSFSHNRLGLFYWNTFFFQTLSQSPWVQGGRRMLLHKWNRSWWARPFGKEMEHRWRWGSQVAGGRGSWRLRPQQEQRHGDRVRAECADRNKRSVQLNEMAQVLKERGSRNPDYGASRGKRSFISCRAIPWTKQLFLLFLFSSPETFQK